MRFWYEALRLFSFWDFDFCIRSNGRKEKIMFFFFNVETIVIKLIVFMLVLYWF